MESGTGFEEFVAIVEAGSVTGAAETLGLPRPTVSRRLARLEERLGVRLLHRTTRRLKATRQGEVLYGKARRVVDAARQAEAEVRRLDGVPRGLLRLSAPIESAQGVFTGWLASFLATYPEVTLEVSTTSAHVDLRASGIDVALRRGAVDPSLITRTLVQDPTIAVASPGYLERAGVPAHPDDLGRHDCIVGYRAGAVAELRWPLLDGTWVPVSSTLRTNHTELRLEAAKQDVGIAMVSQYSAAQALHNGELVHVLPGVIGRLERVSLVYVEREFIDPKVRAFVDFFVAQVAASRR